MEQHKSINKSLNKKHLVITLSIIALIFLAGFWYAYIKQRNSNITVTPAIDSRLGELQSLKDASHPDNSTMQEKIDKLNALYKSSDSTKFETSSRDIKLQELNNISKS